MSGGGGRWCVVSGGGGGEQRAASSSSSGRARARGAAGSLVAISARESTLARSFDGARGARALTSSGRSEISRAIWPRLPGASGVGPRTERRAFPPRGPRVSFPRSCPFHASAPANLRVRPRPWQYGRQRECILYRPLSATGFRRRRRARAGSRSERPREDFVGRLFRVWESWGGEEREREPRAEMAGSEGRRRDNV